MSDLGRGPRAAGGCYAQRAEREEEQVRSDQDVYAASEYRACDRIETGLTSDRVLAYHRFGAAQ